jgi:transcriptional regulator with XRE-family HTH domain
VTTGDRFRRAREASGLTQQQVADRLGCGGQRISDIERGHREASGQWLLWAATVLGWAPGDLDPELTGLGAPLDRIALEHKGRSVYAPASPADAERLKRVGWDDATIPADELGSLAGAARKRHLSVVLLARPED